MIKDRKYKFSWDLIGDISEGRPNLGNTTRIENYRLMQYTFRDIIETVVGSNKTDEIFYRAGKLAGKEFYNHHIILVKDINDLVRQLQLLFQEFGIGILRIEEINMNIGELILTVSEDLDCSGMPEIGDEVCIYDEGFISGILESYVGRPFKVKEIDCWCTGDRTCRFHAKIVE